MYHTFETDLDTLVNLGGIDGLYDLLDQKINNDPQGPQQGLNFIASGISYETV